MHTKRPVITAAAVAAMFGLAACSGSGSGDGAEHSVSIALSTTSCIQQFPLYVAQESGMFEEAGLDVHIERLNGSSAVVQAMLAGQTDLGTPGPVPTAVANAEGASIQYIANMTPGGVFVLVSPEDAGFSSPSDLVGGVIGVSTTDGSEVSFVRTIMAWEGYEEDDYEILVVGEAGAALAGFQRGDIDAYAASTNAVVTMEHGGFPLTDISGEATDHIFGNGLAASAEYIEENPELLTAFGRTLRQARDAAIDDPQLVWDACEKHQPQELEDREYAEVLFEGVIMVTERADGQPWGYMSDEAWELVISDAIEADAIEEGMVEPADAYTNQFVEGYNSDD